MGIHEFDNNIRPDEEFIKGDVSFLVEGNQCRLMDGRRTTGVIEKYFLESATFRWRITKYEDKGKYWDLPAEDIVRFQFEMNSKKLSMEQCDDINKTINSFKEILKIEPNESQRDNTEDEIEKTKTKIIEWLKENSQLVKCIDKVDLSSNEGPDFLANDLMNYMESVGLGKEESLTSEIFVLNPNSGEWIKGLKIVLAEIGLASYNGKIPRTKDIFEGLGDKNNRRRYIVNRLAFIRAYFSLLNINEVVLFRGMSNENQWREISRTFLPATFNLDVAKAFSDFNKVSKYKISYLVKMTVSIEKLFMTYLETEAMNRQYKEAEVILISDEVIMF